MRRIFVVIAGLALAVLATAPARAQGEDPVYNPTAILEDVDCDFDGNGTYETHYDVIGVGVAGHDLDSNSINVAMSGTFTIYDADGNEVRRGSFFTPGVGLGTTSCTWTASLPGGYTVIAFGELLFTPQSG